MNIISPYDSQFQDFVADAAKKLGLTSEQLKTVVGDDIKKINDFFQTKANELKEILNNPHLTADGFEVEYIRIRGEMHQFELAMHQDIQNRLKEQNISPDQIDSFVNSLLDEAKSLSGYSGLIDQLSSRGQTSIFNLAAQASDLPTDAFPPHPAPVIPAQPSPVSYPGEFPIQEPCASVQELYDKFASFLSSDSPYNLSDGAKALIQSLMLVMKSASDWGDLNFADTPDKAWPYLRQQVAPDEDGDVFWRYKGLTQVEFNLINNCGAIESRMYHQQTWPLPGYLANEFEGKISDLIALTKQAPDGIYYNDFLAFLEQDKNFRPDADVSFIQEKARLFSKTPSYDAMSNAAKENFAIFAGVTVSPVINYLQYLKDQIPNGGPLFDMLIRDASDQGISTLEWPNQYLDFINKQLSSFHGGVDVYIYTGVSEETLKILNSEIPGIKIPQHALMDDIINNYLNLSPTELQFTPFYFDLMDQLKSIVRDDTISQNDKPKAFQSYLANLYFSNDQKWSELPPAAQSQFFDAAQITFPQIFYDKFENYLEDSKYKSFLNQFLNGLGSDPMSLEDFRTALTNFLKTVDEKRDFYMSYPTASRDDLQTMFNDLFPNLDIPLPDMTPTDIQYQKTYEYLLEFAVPGSDDVSVLSAILAEIAREGSSGDPLAVTSWVKDYVNSGMNGHSPTELTDRWLKSTFSIT